tara:strand:+ start:1174 stop:1434 length:261 start_codon:yes stop_codon:yes gene_type:complete
MTRRKVVFEGEPTTFGEWLLLQLTVLDKTRKELARETCNSEDSVGAWCRDMREPGIRNFLWTCTVLALWRKEEKMTVVCEASEFFQ